MFSPEGVVVLVVGGSELCQNEIAGSDGGDDEEDLHDGVVEGDVGGQQIQVAGHEDHREQQLRTA